MKETNKNIRNMRKAGSSVDTAVFSSMKRRIWIKHVIRERC